LSGLPGGSAIAMRAGSSTPCGVPDRILEPRGDEPLERVNAVASCFLIEATQCNGSDDNPLQKIRNQVKLAPMNNPALLYGFDRTLLSRCLSALGEGARKKFSRFRSRNPLKSLD
jgi:hypothetical protein